MSKNTLFVGIDISKNTFDVYEPTKGHEKFSNDKVGFKAFRKWLDGSCWCVMEYTGCYYQQLANFLYIKKIQVSVINPLTVKRFIQMKLQRNKTDKSDSKMIALYGLEQELELWIPEPEYIDYCKLIQQSIETNTKHRTALKNKIHSLESKGSKYQVILRSTKRLLKSIKNEIELLEKELEAIIKANEKEMLTHLTSIPGVGRKTAIYLILTTNAFKSFEKASQLKSYFGLAPTDRSSGSSLRGSGRISKQGNKTVRNHLFLCSFTASRCNPQCKALFDRIVDKGKSKKLALVAVSNKLISQAFAIAKSGLPYDKEYKSRLAIKC